MYKAIYKIQPCCLDEEDQTIFSPFINCYYLHSATIYVNGVSYEEDVDFVFEKHKTRWIGSLPLSSKNGDNDTIIFELNYFYMRPDYQVLEFLVDSSFGDQDSSQKIISKH